MPPTPLAGPRFAQSSPQSHQSLPGLMRPDDQTSPDSQSRRGRRRKTQPPAWPMLPLACAIGLSLGLGLGLTEPARAADERSGDAAALSLSVPAGPLAEALNRLALQAGVAIVMDAGKLAGVNSAGLEGHYTVDEALSRLLAGSGFRAVRTHAGYVLESLPSPSPSPSPAAGGAAAGSTGATLAKVLVRAGRTSPEALPETFAGGQVARGARLGLLGNRDVMDTPFNQTSYTADAIANSQAKTLADVVSNDPSVAVDNPTSAGWEAAVIRGFNTGDGTGAVSVNGLYGIAPDSAASVGWAERVEVLKGPGVLLNGMPTSDGIGGSVNIVAKRAPDEPLTELGLHYSSRTQLGVSADLARRFGPDGAIGVRFNGHWRNGDTPVDPIRERLGYGVLGLDFRSSRVRVSLDVGRQERTLSGANRPLFLGSQPIPRVPANDRSYLPGWTVWDSATTFGMVQGEWEITDRVSAWAAVGARRNDGNPVLFINPVLLDGNGDWEATPSISRGKDNARSATAGLRWRFDTGPVRHQLSTNVSWLGQDSKYAQTWGSDWEFTSNLYEPAVVARPDIQHNPLAPSSELRRASIGIADTLSILDERVQFTVGVRRQKVSSKNFSLQTGAINGSYDSHAWSPAFGLIVKPISNLSLYANAIQGLQPGSTVSDRYLNAGEVFAPFKTQQYEAGAKYKWSQRLITTVSLFQIAQPSTVEIPTAPAPTLALDGEQRHRGLEFNVFGEPSAGVRLHGGLMVIDAILRKTDGGEVDGNRAPAVPRWRAALSGEWDTGFVSGLTLTARLRFSERAWIDRENTRSVPSWTLFDVGARYRFDAPWGRDATLRLGLENLFDRNFWVSRTYGVYQSSPRTLMLSLSSRF